MSGKKRHRPTVEVAKELDVGRDILGFLVRFGLVTATERVGPAIVWSDEAVEQARKAIATLKEQRPVPCEANLTT